MANEFRDYKIEYESTVSPMFRLFLRRLKQLRKLKIRRRKARRAKQDGK